MNKIIATDIDYVIHREELLGRFDLQYESLYPVEPRRFRGATDVVERCICWCWYKWLLGVGTPAFVRTPRDVIAKSVRLQNEEQDRFWRAEHDLMCASLAALAVGDGESDDLVGNLVHSDGKPSSDRCAEAWSGFLKYSFLRDTCRARTQAELMFSSIKPINMRLPRKPLVSAFLNEDWRAFGKSLEKSYASLWANFRKCGGISSERDGQIEVVLKLRNARTGLHWQDNALAMLVFRRGVEIPTDPLWLPGIAIAK